MDDLFGFLHGQPGYVVIIVALVAAAAWVASKVWRREGDGGGQEGLRAVDSATEFLTEKALEERGLRRDAERDRDTAQAAREADLAQLSTARAELESAREELESCNRRAQQTAGQAVEKERRRDTS